MYNSALDELRFSDEAKSRMVNRPMAAAEQPSSQLPFIVYTPFSAHRGGRRGCRSGAEHRCRRNRRIQVRERRICRRIHLTADTEIIDQIGRPIGASDTRTA